MWTLVSISIQVATISHLLWAPILDNPRKHYLFGVVSNESEKIVDHVSEMCVRTSVDNQGSYTGVKWVENGSERHVKQSAFEILKLCTVIMLAIALSPANDEHAARWNSVTYI